MRRSECIFVIVEDIAILVPALRAYSEGHIKIAVAKTSEDAEAAFRDDHGAIAVVGLHREDGAELAVRFARNGFRLVICAGGSRKAESKLRSLAPTSFVLKAATPQELIKAIHAALG